MAASPKTGVGGTRALAHSICRCEGLFRQKSHRLRRRKVWNGKSMLTSFERRSAAAIRSLSLGVARTKSTQSTRYPVYAQCFTSLCILSPDHLESWMISEDAPRIHMAKSRSFLGLLGRAMLPSAALPLDFQRVEDMALSKLSQLDLMWRAHTVRQLFQLRSTESLNLLSLDPLVKPHFQDFCQDF